MKTLLNELSGSFNSLDDDISNDDSRSAVYSSK